MRKFIFIVTLILFNSFDRGATANSNQNIGYEIKPLVEKLLVTQFKLDVSKINNKISFKLITDLPDDTQVSISISRSYDDHDGKKYSFDYFQETSSLLKWRGYHSVEISDSDWQQQLKKRKELFRKLGEPIYVKSIDNNLLIKASITYKQPNPKFGYKNRNLDGEEVKKETSGNLISSEKVIFSPLKEVVASKAYDMNYHSRNELTKSVHEILTPWASNWVTQHKDYIYIKIPVQYLSNTVAFEVIGSGACLAQYYPPKPDMDKFQKFTVTNITGKQGYVIEGEKICSQVERLKESQVKAFIKDNMIKCSVNCIP